MLPMEAVVARAKFGSLHMALDLVSTRRTVVEQLAEQLRAEFLRDKMVSETVRVCIMSIIKKEALYEMLSQLMHTELRRSSLQSSCGQSTCGTRRPA